MAIPILEPEEVKKFTDPAPVAGVLYIDSTAPGFYVCDVLLKEIVSALNCFIAGLEKESADIEKRIFNVPLSKLGEQPRPKKLLPTGVVSEALELVAVVEPPRTLGAFQFNFEYSDFIPVKTGWPT